MSQATASAARANVTPEGKAHSAQNSTKHGLNSTTVVLASESQEEYAELLADYLHRYAPVGTAELDLVHEIAAARWRLRRIVRMESAIFDRQIEQAFEASRDADPALVLAENLKPLTMLGRYENRIRRSYEKALVELKNLQTARKSAGEANQQNEPKPEASRTAANQTPVSCLLTPASYANPEHVRLAAL